MIPWALCGGQTRFSSRNGWWKSTVGGYVKCPLRNPETLCKLDCGTSENPYTELEADEGVSEAKTLT